MREVDQVVLLLAGLAHQYCDCIENFDGLSRADAQRLLSSLARLLPRLHAAVAALDGDGCDEFVEEIDLDVRFELYSRLRKALGELDAYWMEFDVARDGQEKSGSLADDLTDIYWELKGGLRQLQRQADVRPTLRRWSTGYRDNWGQHLVDAERHLYALRARRVV